jgi:hypothetical protein
MDDLEERDPRTKQSLQTLLFREQAKQDYATIRKVHKG